jgi:hypothetical protein
VNVSAAWGHATFSALPESYPKAELFVVRRVYSAGEEKGARFH